MVTVQTSSATPDLLLIQYNLFCWISIRSRVAELVCTITQSITVTWLWSPALNTITICQSVTTAVAIFSQWVSSKLSLDWIKGRQSRPERLPYRYCTMHNFCWIRNRTLTGQLADKPTRGQSSRGLDNSRTGQLAETNFKKHGITILYL